MAGACVNFHGYLGCRRKHRKCRVIAGELRRWRYDGFGGSAPEQPEQNDENYATTWDSANNTNFWFQVAPTNNGKTFKGNTLSFGLVPKTGEPLTGVEDIPDDLTFDVTDHIGNPLKGANGEPVVVESYEIRDIILTSDGTDFATKTVVFTLSDEITLSPSMGVRLTNDMENPTNSGGGETFLYTSEQSDDPPLGAKDPLRAASEEEGFNYCKTEVVRPTVGVTTWIAESFYSAETGENAPDMTGNDEGPRNASRNYTVLKYRKDGVEGDEAFAQVGGDNRGITKWVYNALAYNKEDGYLYGVSQNRPGDSKRKAGHLLRISPVDGTVKDLGFIKGLDANSVDVKTGFTNGTFDRHNNYIFANNAQYGSGIVHTINQDVFTGGAAPAVSASTPADENKVLWSANDWATVGFKETKYIWSLNSRNGRRYLHRTNTDTGFRDEWDVTNLRTPSGETLADDIYGNAWTYANGNLGFSANNTGKAYQIAIENDDRDWREVRIALVSSENVPTSYNNDATSNARLIEEFVNSEVDLGVEKELEWVDGKPVWTVTVTNNEELCGSSGFTLRDVISSDLKNAKITPQTNGWLNQSAAPDGSINWTHGPLGPREKAVLRVEADLGPGKCAINKVGVIGNERDSDRSNDVAYDGDCVAQLSIKKYIVKGDALYDAQDANPPVDIEKGEPLTIRYVVSNTGGGTISDISITDTSSGVEADALTQDIQQKIDGELEKFPDGLTLRSGKSQSIDITVDKGVDAYGAFHRNVATANGTFDPKDTSFPSFDPGIPEGYDPFDKELPTRPVTSNDDEANAQTPARITIEKRINGREDAVVKPGENMTIWYRVTNPGVVGFKGVSLIDDVQEDDERLQNDIIAALQDERADNFDLPAGSYREFEISVKASDQLHTNVVKPSVPPATVTHELPPTTVMTTYPVTTIPASTIPGTIRPEVTADDTTYPATEIPETVYPEVTVYTTEPVATTTPTRVRTVELTTTPSATAKASPVKVDLLKEIQGIDGQWLDAEPEQEAALVKPGQPMKLRYTITNTGGVALSGLELTDQVTAAGDDQAKLQGDIEKALKDKIAAQFPKGINLEPGKKATIEISVLAPSEPHTNVATVTAPPVEQPETNVPGVTITPVVDGTTTVPGKTVTESPVASTDVAPAPTTNQAKSTPTTDEVPPAVVPDPQFAVEKLGNQSGIELKRNEDGQYGYSAEYTIRVRNTGSIAGKHAKISDVPVRGVGFDINSVTVDGTEVKPENSRYLISEEAELAVGGYKDFQVVVNGTVSDQAANALPAAVGQCDAVTTQNPGAGSGLVNTVEMGGDSDGPANNIVCEPVELRRLNIEKRIDGRENAPVTPGDEMEIWYRVRNTGNVTLSGITLADQIKEDNPDLQKEIDAAIAKIEAFDLAPGEVKDITFPVTAYEGEHTNEVRAEVPETTVPGTTRPETSIPETTVPPVTVPGTTNSETTVPETTIPGSTVPATTIPGTTVPDRPVPPTTVTATAHANSPKLEIKKYINGYDEGTQVAPGEDMEILYRVANTGSVRIDGIRLDDEVTEAADEQVSKALQRDINAALKKEAPFALEPGEVREVRITVPAPAGGHVNVAKPIVPPVTVPGTTIPGTTNPKTTVPGTTVPSTVVTVTTPSDDARSDSPILDIKKYINNIDDGDIVNPGDDMAITYRVFNNGNVDAKGVTIADEVTEGSKATKADLTDQIKAELDKIEPFDVPAGGYYDVEITVKAPEGGHVNVARPVVPPVTVPATTIPGTTNPRTTIPETTVPERVVTQTTTPSDDARSDSLRLEILKDIFSLADNEWHAADDEDDAAVVDANGKMRVRYTVTNTGSVTLSGIDIIDNVTRLDEGDQQALTDALNGALEAEGRGFTLKPGEKKVVEITVDAPKGYHVNEAIATAPAVPTTQTQVSSVPGTTDATTTVPGSLTTTVVTTEKTPNVPTNTAQATPTTSATTPVPPVTTTAPAPERPQFAVEKLGARAGNVALTRNEEGSYDYSNEYVIRVRNSGLVDGEHATIWDVPLRGAGFTVNEVTVDNKAVEVENGRYKVADAAELPVGEYKDYRITVTGTLAEAAANNLPEAVGQCTAEGANPGADSGLVNVVNMSGDSDGPGNNVVCTPVELRRLNIEKRINGREDASVTPGEKMEIWYRVTNTGNVELTDIALADQIREDNPELQEEINAELAEKAKPFNLAPGAIADIRIEVTAPEGEHVNEARAEVPPVTVPETTRPGTTIPGTTGPSTTVPPVTIPETTLPGTTRPGTTVSTTARANSPLLEVKKFINGRDEHALVNAGEDMDITYRVTNKGTLPIRDIRLTDEVQEDNAELQQAIDAQLGKVAPFALEPGESMDVTVTVKAPAGRHDNVAGVTVPPVTIPATTIPGTTNPHTTVPETVVPSTVVTVTAPPDDASSDSPQLEILKEIKREDEGDDAWRDAEEAGDALPIGEGETMELRYTVRNTGSVALEGVDVVDNVTRLDEGDADEFTALINDELEKTGRGLALEPGESAEIVITVAAPAGYHVNEAIATAPPVTATETVVSSIPGTTNETTTVPGTVTTETTVVERTPNTPTNKAQSTPTTGAAPCDCEVTTITETPAPVTTTKAGKVTTVTPDPVTSEVTITETPDPVTSEVTTTEIPEPIVTTVVQTQDPITVTRTTPVTTVQTVTPEPQTVVTTVEGPEVTTTPDVPGQVVVVVDDSGKTVTEVAPTPVDGYTPPVTATATYTLPPVVTETLPQVTVTEVETSTPAVVTPTGTPDEGSVLGRCVANAVRSPILYMVPLLLAGQVLGEVAAPYVKAVNDQFNQISAEIQDEIRRKTPDFGHGRRGHENEQVAELRAKAEAANRMLQELAMRPEVQEYGQWAAIAAGVVVAGSVLYDWCTNEAGEAFTAIGPNKSSSIDDVRVGGSSLGGDRVTTVVPPVTNTPGRDETGEDAGEAAGEAGSAEGSSDGSSAGSSEGSSN